MDRRSILRAGLGLGVGAVARRGASAWGAFDLPYQVERGLPVDGGFATIQQRMAHYKVPGVSVGVIAGGLFKWARGYGVLEAGHPEPVTAETLFQAASISKAVAAMAAMRLVQDGKLALDEDVNRRLRSWKLPPSDAAKGKPVTLRMLLSHTGGLNVHGFGGYEAGAKVPTLRQVLDGTPPANSAAIRIVAEPGARYAYSGGGFEVLQQLIEDVTGRPFAAAMRELVLDRVGMKSSTFEQPLPASRAKAAAVGHDKDGQPVAGRWHTYPEQAAAGLWTTATDLVHFANDLGESASGRSNRVLRLQTARAMLSRQQGGHALGVALNKEGATGFMHGGANAGYRCLMLVLVASGNGVVIMTSGEQGDALYGEIVQAVGRVYSWPTNVF